jgi:hypothetical protein
VTSESLIHQAISQGVSVISCHTNFDQSSLEVVKAVSHGLGVTPRGRLIEKPEESLLKLSVFVPRGHVDQVRDAICVAGAGHIGNYDFCAFEVFGNGSFRGSAHSRPFIGKPGQLEKLEEIRLETTFPRGLKAQVLRALAQSHPYEEVAYDLYPLVNKPASEGLIKGMGYGFWGEFDRPRPFSEIAKDVKRIFKIRGFLLTGTTGPDSKQIKRLAFVAGKGSSFVKAASSLKCDLFITGEAGYHDALSSSRNGMTVMELGHRESERFFLTTMEGWLHEAGIKSVSLNLPTQRRM